MDNSKYVFEMKENIPVRTADAKSLHEMNTNELRDLAVSLGADKNKLYGTSKQALIVIIDKLKREKSNDMRTVDEVVTVNESDFVSSHVKNPKGYGHWIFGIGSKNMGDWFETTGTYAESKKRAIEEAKKKGKTTIYTMG